jgi:hypothetical protein
VAPIPDRQTLLGNCWQAATLATQQCVIRQHLREGVEWITQMRERRVRP